MGHRANLVVATDVGYDLFYSHWRASSLDRDLFWGPTHALAFIRQQRSRAAGAEWLDEVWAEGGALIDLPNSRLLWWGGEDMKYDVPRRRVYLELMARVWVGWDIRWAHEGIVDLARYVDLAKEHVLTAHEDDICEPDLSAPKEWRWVSGVVSITGANGESALYPVSGDVENELWNCDSLVALAAKQRGYSTLDLGDRLDGFPTGGAHVDARARRVSFWTASDKPDIEARLAATNPSWHISWERDRFETQLASTPHLIFPSVRTEDIVEGLSERLLAADFDYNDYILVVSGKTHPGQKVEVNPFALRDDPLAIDDRERRRIWDDALRAWRAT